ncbi:MAG: hypothetical protein Q9164_004718, partial [Protoblastenia rupestris]
MPPAAQRKRVALSSQCLPAISSHQRGIQSFGKISKPQSTLQGKSNLKRQSGPKQDTSQSVLPSANDRKRKCDALEDASGEEQDAKENIFSLHNKSSTPCKRAGIQIASVQTPTKGARSYLELFSLHTSPTKVPSPEPQQLETPPSSQDEKNSRDLPEELQDL